MHRFTLARTGTCRNSLRINECHVSLEGIGEACPSLEVLEITNMWRDEDDKELCDLPAIEDCKLLRKLGVIIDFFTLVPELPIKFFELSIPAERELEC